MPIRIVYNDPIPHCVDVDNGAGENVLRFRPFNNGVSLSVFDPRSGQSVFLSADDLRELASALDLLAR